MLLAFKSSKSEFEIGKQKQQVFFSFRASIYLPNPKHTPQKRPWLLTSISFGFVIRGSKREKEDREKS